MKTAKPKKAKPAKASKNLTKHQLFKKIEAHLKDFTLFEEQEKKTLHTRKQFVKLLKEKKYRFLRSEALNEFWIKAWTPGNIGQNKRELSFLNKDNYDYSVVVLQTGVGTEGLVSTLDKRRGFTSGLYDAGGVFTINELYEHIKESR